MSRNLDHELTAVHPTLAHEDEATSESSSRLRRAVAVGSAALGLFIGGCGSPDALPERNAPETTAPYLVDTTTAQYNNLVTARDYITDPGTRENLERVIATPIAKWLTEPTLERATESVRDGLAAAGQSGSIPVFVTYNMPGSDLGGESAGGLATPADFQAWVGAISETIADAPAVVIVEPDALAAIPQMPEAARNERILMLRGALEAFSDNPQTAVYLDAGHSDWLDAREVATLLSEVDPSGALIRGIALNVSNQRPTVESRAYAAQLRELFGDLFVIHDVSMNGAQNTADLVEWCNPEGEYIGTPDDLTFDPLNRDEEIYVKEPGPSDGQCGTAPDVPAGEFSGSLLVDQLTP